MSRKGISFRLRKIDSDLEAAVASMDATVLSDMCRDGLRLALGLRTTKRVEVTEMPLSIPEAITIRSAPAAWVKKQK